MLIWFGRATWTAHRECLRTRSTAQGHLRPLRYQRLPDPEHHDACSCFTLHVAGWCGLRCGTRKKFFFASGPAEIAGNFLSLTVANADQAVTVTNDDQCGEAEATTTLDDLETPVDGHNALDVLVLLPPHERGYGAHHGRRSPRICCAPRAGWRSQRFPSSFARLEFRLRSARSLECKTSLACTVSNGCNTAVVLVTTAVRLRLPQHQLPWRLCNELTNARLSGLVRSATAQLCFHGGSGCQGYALDIVDLNEHVTGPNG